MGTLLIIVVIAAAAWAIHLKLTDPERYEELMAKDREKRKAMLDGAFKIGKVACKAGWRAYKRQK